MTNHMTEPRNEYKTRDLYEGAFLIANNCRLVRFDRYNTKQVWFIFEEYRQCQELSNLYWSGQGIVKATFFVDAIRKLKDRIFSQQDSFDAGVVEQEKGG